MSKCRLGRAKVPMVALLTVTLIGNALPAERELILGTPTPASPSSTGKITAAIELGYFAEEGIKLKLQQFPTTVPVMEAAVAKRIDIGGGGVFPLVIANQRLGGKHMPLRFFYNHIRRFAFEIVVPPESPLRSIADLKGKKLGVLSLTSPYASVTRTVLKENGLGPGDVQLVPTGENRATFERLMDGQIDAYETFTGNSALYEAEGHKLKRLPYEARFYNLLTYSYYVREDMLKAEPKLLAGFGRAIAKGVVTCGIAPAWCVKTFWKYYPALKPAPEAMGRELARQVYVLKDSMKGLLAFPAGEPQRFGEYPDDAFKNLIDILHEGGELSTADLDPKTLYTNELVSAFNDFDLAAVKARAVTLQ